MAAEGEAERKAFKNEVRFPMKPFYGYGYGYGYEALCHRT